NEVLEHVPPMSLPIATSDTPVEIAPAQPAALLRDVYTLLTVAKQSPIPLTARGLIAKRALIRLDTQLRVPEDAAAVTAENELVRRLKRRAYELLFPRQLHAYTSPYRDSSGNPLNWTFAPPLDEERGWDLVEWGLIRVVIGQSLHWLGVVDIGQAGTGGAAI